jgi:hypothetical protein
MKKFTADDIANVYFQHVLAFKGLEPNGQEEDEDLLLIGHASKDVELISRQELINDFDISSDVADKLIGYQMNLIASYRNAVTELLRRTDRYVEIKPYLEDRTLSKAIFTEYVTSDWDRDKQLKEFQPMKHLRSGIIGTLMSCGIFILVVSLGWGVHAPVEFDFIWLGLVAFIWLGLTAMIARELPGEYRARKIVWDILNSHNK